MLSVFYTGLLLFTALTANSQGIWSTLPGMSNQVGFMAYDQDGQSGYIAGGAENLTGSLNTFYRFNPEGPNWIPMAPLPQAKCGACMVILNDKIYVLGGMASLSGIAYKTMHVYDPSTNSWSACADMPVVRAYFAACALNGKIYALGGVGDFAILGGTAEVDVYDPTTNTWTQAKELPHKLGGMVCEAIGGKIYVAGGGEDYSSPADDRMYIYDPQENIWQEGPSMPVPTMLTSSCEMNGKMYVLGGAKSTGAEAEIPDFQVYDPLSNTWQQLPDMPTVRQGLACFSHNGRIYGAGGTHDFSGIHYILSILEMYDPQASPTQNPLDEECSQIISVMPNPLNDHTQLSVCLDQPGVLRAEVWNLEGQVVRSLELGKFYPGVYSFPIELNKVEAGYYSLKVTLNGKVIGTERLSIR